MCIFPQHSFSPIIVILLLCLFLSLLHPLFAYVLCISSILKISNESAILFDCKKAVCSLTQFQHNTVVAVKNLNTHFCLHSRLVSVTFFAGFEASLFYKALNCTSVQCLQNIQQCILLLTFIEDQFVFSCLIYHHVHY